MLYYPGIAPEGYEAMSLAGGSGNRSDEHAVSMKVIAHIRTELPSKFGIPRQSGLVEALEGRVVFTHDFRNPDYVRGLEGFSHIWLIWQFSEVPGGQRSATVRPPRLGGNARMGLFATRSPFRPNPIGLSCVRLLGVDYGTALGPVLRVCGVDMLDGTPVLDIKPYLAYTDAHPEARGGYADELPERALEVRFPEALLMKIPAESREALMGLLAHDPRPSYQDCPGRRYGITFAGHDIRFHVQEGALTVCEVEEI